MPVQIKMVCNKHYRYQAKRKPTSPCEICWRRWIEKLQEEEAEARIALMGPFYNCKWCYDTDEDPRDCNGGCSSS